MSFSVVYVCSKCGAKSLNFHLCSQSRIVCERCHRDLMRLIEQYRTEPVPK